MSISQAGDAGETGGRRHHAFTLVELLVVIGIIALLVSILLPSLNRAREAASRTACLSNLRQFGAGLQMYAIAYKGVWPRYYQAGGSGWIDSSLSTTFAYGNDRGIYPLGRYGLGLLYPFFKSSTIFFCPSGQGIPFVDGSRPLDWSNPPAGSYLYGSYALRSIWNTNPSESATTAAAPPAALGLPAPAGTAKLPSMLRGSLNKYALVSCWFLYYTAGGATNGIPLSFHKLKFPVLFADGHCDLGQLDHRIDPKNPPDLYESWGWQCRAWDSFDQAPNRR